MSAYRIIEGASFGPEVLTVLRSAFDEAWGATAHTFAPHEHDMARETLAHAIMNMARDNSEDMGRLRDAGIRAMQAVYPTRFQDDSSSKSEDWEHDSKFRFDAPARTDTPRPRS